MLLCQPIRLIAESTLRVSETFLRALLLFMASLSASHSAYAKDACTPVECAAPVPDGGYQYIFLHPDGSPYVTGDGISDSTSLGVVRNDLCQTGGTSVERFITTFAGSPDFASRSLAFRERASGQIIMAQAGTPNYGSSYLRLFDVTNADQPVQLSQSRLSIASELRTSYWSSGDFVSDDRYLAVFTPRNSQVPVAQLIDISNVNAPVVVSEATFPAQQIQRTDGQTLADDAALNCIPTSSRDGLICIGLKTIRTVRVLGNGLQTWTSPVIAGLDLEAVYSRPQDNPAERYLHASALSRSGADLYLTRVGVHPYPTSESYTTHKVIRLTLQPDLQGINVGDVTWVGNFRNAHSASSAILEQSGEKFLYIGSGGWDLASLVIYNIRTDGTLELIAERSDLRFSGLNVRGDRLFFANLGAEIIMLDISDPENPRRRTLRSAITCDNTLAGDMNCDDRRNNFDIDPFTLAITNSIEYETRFPMCHIMRGDLNDDGAVDNFDMDFFIERLINPT